MSVRVVMAALLIFAGIAADSAAAAVEASVDRARVRLNESFTYTLRFEGEPDAEPELEPLERDFDILQRSQSTRIQGANGQYSQFTEWLVVLMPTGVGSFAIPGVRVGGQISNTVTVQVTAADDGEAPGDIFLEVSAEPQHPFVQAQSLYTVSLFLGIDTRGSRLSEPKVAGGEAIVEKLGDDRQFQVERDGRRFIVIERRYAIFPQEAGNLTIEPMRFETQVLNGRRFSRIQRFSSDAIELMVRGAVAPPPEYAAASWLPARSLQLTERFAGEAESLVAGIPVTRSLILTADGVLSTQLPELALSTIEPIKQYPDQPELENTVTAEGLRAQRTERFAVISTRAGEFELPGLAVPWFNVVEERWEAAQLARRTVAVTPDPDQPIFAEPEAALALAEQPVAVGPWRLVSLGLAVGWAASLMLMLGFNRRSNGGQQRRETAAARERQRRRSSRLLSQIRRACSENDPTAARQRLIAWGQQRFPDNPPATLGALGRRVDPAVGAALVGLEAALYGTGGQQAWRGEALLEALKRIDAVASVSESPGQADGLSPLYR